MPEPESCPLPTDERRVTTSHFPGAQHFVAWIVRVEMFNGNHGVNGIAPNLPLLVRRQRPKRSQRRRVAEMLPERISAGDPRQRRARDVLNNGFFLHQIEPNLAGECLQMSVLMEVFDVAGLEGATPHLCQRLSYTSIVISYKHQRGTDMAQIALRGVPDLLHQELRHAAKRNHRSLNREILTRLEASVRHSVTDVEGLLERIRRRREEIGELDLSDGTLRELKSAGRL